MESFGLCNDTSDAVKLSSRYNLYLKPFAKLYITVQLPVLNTPGKSISNWEVMERLKTIITPNIFLVLKVSKSSLEIVKFEAEVETRELVKKLVGKLDGRTIKLSGFSESLKVKAVEFKMKDPTKHDWDAFFRDAQDMDEMKPGERPDTIFIKNLPCRWFSTKSEKEKPNEAIVKEVFETFGSIRAIDIPILNPCNKETTNTGIIQTFTFGQNFCFNAYIQYNEYGSFVRGMNALKGMKLLLKEEDNKALTASIRVDFDRTKHLSIKNIRKRQYEVDAFKRIEREKHEEEKRQKEAALKQIEDERLREEQERVEKERKEKEKIKLKEERQKQREEARKIMRMRKRQEREHKRQEREHKRLQKRINMEERKILIARRKLESIRLFSELFNRIKKIKQREELAKKEAEAEAERRREVEEEMRRQLAEEQNKLKKEKKRKEILQKEEEDIRKRIVKNFKMLEEKKMEKKREELRKKVSGKLKSAIVIKR